MNLRGQVWMDPITRLDGVVVSCDRRMVEFNYHLDAMPTDLRDGWEGRKQSDWNASWCKDWHLREWIKRGGRITAVFSFANGGQVRLVAGCSVN